MLQRRRSRLFRNRYRPFQCERSNYYPYAVLDKAMKKLQSKIDRRSFLGELDHEPFAEIEINQTNASCVAVPIPQTQSIKHITMKNIAATNRNTAANSSRNQRDQRKKSEPKGTRLDRVEIRTSRKQEQTSHQIGSKLKIMVSR